MADHNTAEELTGPGGAGAAAQYGALVEFERLAALAALAPGVARRLAVAAAATDRGLRLGGRTADAVASTGPASADELVKLDEPAGSDGADEGDGADGSADPDRSMRAALDDFRRRTASNEWWEALIAAELCSALSDELLDLISRDAAEPGAVNRSAVESDAVNRSAVEPASGSGDGPLGRTVDADADWSPRILPLPELRAALDADPVLCARLALWGRRVAGEGIVLARRLGGARYPALAERLAIGHAGRLARLGLAEPAASVAAAAAAGAGRPGPHRGRDRERR